MFRSLIIVLLLSACAQTYWAFPTGRTHLDFQRDEAACRISLATYEACLVGSGYRQITQAEFVSMNRRAMEKLMRPVDIVAFDVKTGHLYVGKATTTGDGQSSVIEITGITTGGTCTGYSEIKKVVPGFKGSMGTASILCRDGRRIRGDFVYETARSGYGVGTEIKSGQEYRFLFGDLDIDPESLRKQFEELIKDKGKMLPGKSA